VTANARILNALTAPLAAACILAPLAAALTACESWPKPASDRPEIEAEPPRSWGRDVRRDPTPLGPLSQDDVNQRVERVVERGTGTFLNPADPRARGSITTDARGEISLNVVDAELREVVRLVLEDALGANYVIDPAVGGRITVQTTRPVPAEDLVPVLDAVLRMNGAALVQSGDLFRVVPIDQALTSGPMPEVRPLPGARSDRGFGVRVVPLRFVAATELAPLLEPFTPPGGTVQVDAARNLLLLAGASEQLVTLQDLISIFDVDWMRGMSFGLFPLETAAASELAQELDQVFGGTEEGPLTGIVRVVPIERLNAVLVVSSQPGYLDQAETWVERLDRVGEGEEPEIYVYPVQNGRAATLAEVLSEIFDARTATIGEPSLLAPGLEPIELTSTQPFGLGGAEDLEQQDQEPLMEQTEADERRRQARSGPGGTRSGLAATRAGTLGGEPGAMSPAGGPADVRPEDEIRIIADDSTNALVIRASPRNYRKIRDALEKLDILPLQVLIEATIAEVTLRDQLRYGLEWFFRSGEFQTSFSARPTGRVTPRFPGFSALFASPGDAAVVLHALEDITDVDVISSPQVVVLDNQTAQLQVGDQVPILSQQAQSVTDTDAPVVNSIEQVQTGVILSVTPRVNAGGLVTMEIQQEVSDAVETTSSDINSPTISQRRIASTVAVQSGETVALGGLIRDNRDNRQTGLPLLSSIPVIGWLFGVTDRTSERTELLVLITPSVIGSQEEARAVTEELRRRLSGVEPIGTRLRGVR
jgi:general secretion pathway protein D